MINKEVLDRDVNEMHKMIMQKAREVSLMSKDRSTKVGCAVTDENYNVLVTGYNSFPQGIDEGIDERHERPLKYKWTEHSERNAIYKAAREGIRLKGGRMYLIWFPCVDCARAIIQAGIKELVVNERPNLEDATWGNDFKIAIQMLKEAGITVTYLEEQK